MSIKGQGHSLTLVKGHSDFKVKCLTFALYTQVSDSGPLGPFVSNSDSSLSKFTRELKIRVIGFVLKRLLIYIEMLSVCVCM